MDLRTVIVYRSKHHGNTKKLVVQLSRHTRKSTRSMSEHSGRTSIPTSSPYHVIIMASGIYYGNFDKDLRALPTTAYVTATRS